MYGVIFDCDGVLVDSEKWSCGAWLPVLHERGIQATLADIEVFIGRSDRAVLDHYRQLSGVPLDPQVLLPEKEQQYFDLARGRLQTFTGLAPTLQNLQERQVPMAVASSGSPAKIRFSLEQTGLLDFFPHLCSAVEVSRGKPAPDLFLLAAERLGLAPERCAVIEDSVPGIEAANAAGMLSIGFVSSHPQQILQQAGADRLLSHYGDLPAQLAEAGFLD